MNANRYHNLFAKIQNPEELVKELKVKLKEILTWNYLVVEYTFFNIRSKVFTFSLDVS